MAIYSTDTYEILSIMNYFEVAIDNVITFRNAKMYVQVLPKTAYQYVLPADIHPKYGLVQDDYDVYDRFVANVIPIFETVCFPILINNSPEGTAISANSAISPISMLASSVAL